MRNPYKEKDGKKYLHVTSGLSIIRMEWIEKWRGDYGNDEFVVKHIKKIKGGKN